MAIKIFTDPAAFVNEQQVYSIEAVADAVGVNPTFMKTDDGTALMPSGQPFPPFTVSERARSLEVWMNSYAADTITSMQVTNNQTLSHFSGQVIVTRGFLFKHQR